jgi:2-dehydro-3-deoxygluconokinase
MDGASLLHLSGITAALGPGGQAISRAAVAAAHAAGVPVSFDPNYRETLWKAWDSRPSDALRELADEADILFAGRRGMELLLGQSFSDKDLQDGNEMAAAGFSAFPRLQVIASMTRDPVNQAHQRLTARVDRPGESHQTREIEVPNIVDRIGTGDAFAAGVLDAWLAGADSRKMAETGLALGALKHGIYGDFCQVSRSELAGFTGRARDVLR